MEFYDRSGADIWFCDCRSSVTEDREEIHGYELCCCDGWQPRLEFSVEELLIEDRLSAWLCNSLLQLKESCWLGR